MGVFDYVASHSMCPRQLLGDTVCLLFCFCMPVGVAEIQVQAMTISSISEKCVGNMFEEKSSRSWSSSHLPFPSHAMPCHAVHLRGRKTRSVTCIGYTDLPSRLPQTSSQLYANNIAKLILATGPQTTKKKGVWYIDHEDPVSRGMLVVEKGKASL